VLIWIIDVLNWWKHSSRCWTSLNGWKLWPSQRPLSISLDPGCRLSRLWSTFVKCPVWCYL